ncbi:uncharacterized protein [Physcomitrium patens]|uniref:Uncharacterized protein n=1 Tax=Physcomitrium patens TaxID=3218 RepID=A0A2K1KTS8_PHYPA|nr:hypothetical protein PHYPA_004172 [Physcomitrium patens]
MLCVTRLLFRIMAFSKVEGETFCEPRVPRATSSSDHSLDSAMQQMDFMTALQKGEKSAVEQALRSMVFQGGLPVNFVNFSPVKSAVILFVLSSFSFLSIYPYFYLFKYLVNFARSNEGVIGGVGRALVSRTRSPQSF